MEYFNFAQLANLNTNVWLSYKKDYQNDIWAIEKLNKDITYIDVVLSLVQPPSTQFEKIDFYELIGVSDSIVRERIFWKLVELTGLDYDYFYKLWLYKF